MMGTLDTYQICCYSTVPPLWHFNNQNIRSLRVDFRRGNTYFCLVGDLSQLEDGVYKCSGINDDGDDFAAEKYIPLIGITMQTTKIQSFLNII